MSRRPALLRLLVVAGVLLGLVVAPVPAGAAHHSVKISEIFAGTPSHPAAQYVELQAYAPGQNRLTGSTVRVYSASGANRASYRFTADVADGSDQATVLLATAEAAALFGVTPDLTMSSARLLPAGGKVCWLTGATVHDCIAWGSYAGSSAGVGSPFRPGEGIVPGAAAHRSTAPGDPGRLEAVDDTDDSATDVAFAYPSPRTNAGTVGESSSGGLHLTPGFPTDENDPAMTHNVLRYGSREAAVTVEYTTTDTGTATPGVDFVPTSGVLEFPADRFKMSIRIEMLQDAELEPAETVGLRLRAPSGGAVFDVFERYPVLEDDDPQLAVDDITVPEAGSAGSPGSALVAVRLTPASSEPVTVRYDTAAGTARSADYVQTTRARLTFEPGQTTAYATVPLLDDALDEPDETFTLALSEPAGASAPWVDHQATVTIADDDPIPMVDVGDVSVVEPDSPDSVLVDVPVRLRAASGRYVTVSFGTVAGTASTRDYVTRSGSVSFSPGRTERVVRVRVKGDLLAEPDETFSVVLSSPVNAEVGDGEGIVTVVDDD